jgi:selenocysteine lyase/cysteine desulfurase
MVDRGTMSERAVSPLGAPAVLSCQREAFSLPDEVHYLNCAYFSPLPKATEEAGIAGILQKRRPMVVQATDFFTESDRARELFARLVGVSEPNCIAIIPSASYGVAVAARNLAVEQGQNIVLLHEQFPGNVYAWRRKADESGAQVRTVVPPDGRKVEDRAVGPVDVGARAREVGAALVVDATQSVGAMPFDVGEIQPDALIVAGYKWLLGPYSIGAVYLGSRFDDGIPLEETWIGRERSEEFQHLVDYQSAYQPGAIRYDVGERSNFILLPMFVASLGLVLEWTPEGVREYCLRLGETLIREAVSIGFSLEQDEWRAAHLFGLRMPEGLELTALKAELEARKIFVSLRGSALRVSPHLYNDEDDVGALIDALRAVV